MLKYITVLICVLPNPPKTKKMFSQISLAMTLSLHKLRPILTDSSEFGRALNSLAFFAALCMTQIAGKLMLDTEHAQ
jgi:hypothetical protein